MNGTAPAPPDLGAAFKNGELPAGHGLTWAGWAKRAGARVFGPAGILLAFGIHQLLTASIPTGIGMIGAALALGLALMVSDMRKRFRRVYVMRAGPSRPERRTEWWLKTDAEKLPASARHLAGKRPVYYLDMMGETPRVFDPHMTGTPEVLVPSSVGRMANQQDVAELNKATHSKVRSEVIRESMYLVTIGILLLFGWVMAQRVFEATP